METVPNHSVGAGSRIRKHSASSAESGHGAGSNDFRTWQSILDGLTIKARKECTYEVKGTDGIHISLAFFL